MLLLTHNTVNITIDGIHYFLHCTFYILYPRYQYYKLTLSVQGWSAPAVSPYRLLLLLLLRWKVIQSSYWPPELARELFQQYISTYKAQSTRG